MAKAVYIDVLFNIATILEIDPYVLPKFSPYKKIRRILTALWTFCNYFKDGQPNIKMDTGYQESLKDVPDKTEPGSGVVISHPHRAWFR